VRFKNRYRRAQQLEEQQQQQHCETLRDFNHNETSKVCEVEMNYSPVEDHRVTENMYYSASPSRILSDPSAVRRSLGEKGHISEETRPPEKRTWSRIILESDLLDPWMSSSKVPYHDATVDSRRIDVDRELKRPENEKLPTKYQQVHQRSLEYQNCIVSCGQPKCERHFSTCYWHKCFFYSFIASIIFNDLVQSYSFTICKPVYSGSVQKPGSGRVVSEKASDITVPRVVWLALLLLCCHLYGCRRSASGHTVCSMSERAINQRPRHIQN